MSTKLSFCIVFRARCSRFFVSTRWTSPWVPSPSFLIFVRFSKLSLLVDIREKYILIFKGKNKTGDDYLIFPRNCYFSFSSNYEAMGGHQRPLQNVKEYKNFMHLMKQYPRRIFAIHDNIALADILIP